MPPNARAGAQPQEEQLSPQLPRIDEHSVEVAAPPALVWDALLARRPRDGRLSAFGAALLGCRERRAHGPPDRAGSTVVGFRVARADRPETLALEGEHRFSSYALTFAIEPRAGGERSLVTAITDAEFPGPHGRVYRALVIGTRMHVRALRGTLARVKARAERDAAAARR